MLAVRQTPKAAPEELDYQLISFVVGSESFAVDIMMVSQIIRYQGSTPVPTAPAFVEGIIVLRDEVIPILDLKQRLFPRFSGEETPKKLIFIVRLPEAVVGLKVDSVNRIIRVPARAVMPPPPLARGVAGALLAGVIHHEGAVCLYLDVRRVLSAAEKEELGEMKSGAE